MACQLEDLLDEGIFIRAFECTAFRRYAHNQLWFSLDSVAKRMPAEQFERDFSRCAVSEMDRKHPSPTSYVRHGLPIKAYAGGFGACPLADDARCLYAARQGISKSRALTCTFVERGTELPVLHCACTAGLMIRANVSRVTCACAFDAYNVAPGRRCRSTVGTVEQHVVLRQRLARKACKHSPYVGVAVVHAANHTVNCCWDSVGDAVESQRRYALWRHNQSKCIKTDSVHNQMQLWWREEDIVGAFYVQSRDKRWARRLLEALAQERRRRTNSTHANASSQIHAHNGSRQVDHSNSSASGQGLQFCRLW